MAVALAILIVIWFVLLYLTLHGDHAPGILNLLAFQLLVLATVVLAYMFLVKVYKWNPNPVRVNVARWIIDDKMIYLGDIVPGLSDLDFIERVDTDGIEEKEPREWVAFYQYDTRQEPGQDKVQGPFGAAIYDYDECRPATILSYELAQSNYDYLGEARLSVTVGNIIPYQDPQSANADFPEVIVNGVSREVVTDLNIFRRTGVAPSCLERQDWQKRHPGEPFPNPVRYENVGSFRGSYQIQRSGSTVTVVDRAGFERSQFVVRRTYEPVNGSYFGEGSQVLRSPMEYSLGFGPGEPDEVTQVYYPEKAVLAFYLNLGKDKAKLQKAESYLSEEAQERYNIRTDPFGLSLADDSMAQARGDLERVLVWEIRYEPDYEAEQLHQERQVQVTVVGVNKDGEIDERHSCEVTWSVIGYERPGALPYGCEWRLDEYQSSCYLFGN